MENSFKPVARKENLVIQDAADEVLVYDLASNKAHCLNPTAAFIWRSCDGANSIDEIGQLLSSETGTQIPVEMVWLAVDQLQEKELLAKGVVLSGIGQSRRDMIKKVGLGLVVALPVVASLVAPKSAMASTSCTCVVDNDCLLQPGCGPSCNAGTCGAAPPSPPA